MYCWSRKCTRQAAILGFLELCPGSGLQGTLLPFCPLPTHFQRRQWETQVGLRSPAVSFDEAPPSGALGAQARPMQQEDHPGRGTGHTQESIVQHAEELGGA